MHWRRSAGKSTSSEGRSHCMTAAKAITPDTDDLESELLASSLTDTEHPPRRAKVQVCRRFQASRGSQASHEGLNSGSAYPVIAS
jgi:hypothetical protein